MTMQRTQYIAVLLILISALPLQAQTENSRSSPTSAQASSPSTVLGLPLGQSVTLPPCPPFNYKGPRAPVTQTCNNGPDVTYPTTLRSGGRQVVGIKIPIDRCPVWLREMEQDSCSVIAIMKSDVILALEFNFNYKHQKRVLADLTTKYGRPSNRTPWSCTAIGGFAHVDVKFSIYKWALRNGVHVKYEPHALTNHPDRCYEGGNVLIESALSRKFTRDVDRQNDQAAEQGPKL